MIFKNQKDKIGEKVSIQRKLQMDPPYKAGDHQFHHRTLEQQNTQMASQQNTECKHACT